MSSTLTKSTIPQFVLGLDYGEKRIGTALLIHGLPEPLGVIAHSPTMFQEIELLCQEHGVGLIVVGISEGKTEEATREFIASLQKAVSIPVETWDETLSTQEAAEKYRHALNKYPIDALAACAILEDWQACLPHLEDADPDFIGTG